MEYSILSIEGKDTGKKVTLAEEIFGVVPNDHSIYLDVKQYLANQRQGTHKSKERNEVAGSTRKIKKQKGTGGARAGAITSPTIVGGGRIFGPRPRDYGFKLNKKVKQLARRSALAYKALDRNITVLEDFSFAAPRTKSYIKFLADLSLTNKKTLVVLLDETENVYLSSRNLPKTKVIAVADINTYDVLNAEELVISVSALSKIEEILN
jgi:large subunit ribosomal protein L4